LARPRPNEWPFPRDPVAETPAALDRVAGFRGFSCFGAAVGQRVVDYNQPALVQAAARARAERSTAVRYLLIIVIAIAVDCFHGWPEDIGAPARLATLSVAATILIVLPTFALQAGIAHAG
jgi:hypothetical protein